MSKHIAVQLFGHLRSFMQTYNSFDEYIVKPNKARGYNIDVFMHTWTETDHSSITWHNWDGSPRGRSVDQNVIDFIHNHYKPVKLAIEEQLKIEDNFIITEKIAGVPRAYEGVVNVAYTKFRSTQLRNDYEQETGTSYDYVIITRPDIVFHRAFDIDNFLHVYTAYGWKIPQQGLFFGHNLFARGNVEDKHLLGGIDIVFFGAPENINKATSLYGMLKDNTLTQAEIAQDFYCFEIFWYDFWLRKGLEPIRLKYFQFSDYNIIRNEKDYGIATQNAKQKQAEVDGIKINLVNNANENIVFNLPNEQEHTKAPVRSVQLLKIKRELLKIFPYFLVKQKIERLDRKICELKGQSR